MCIYIYIPYPIEATEMAAKYLLNKKNVFLVTLKISHIVVTTALKKICIYIYIKKKIFIFKRVMFRVLPNLGILGVFEGLEETEI